MKRKIFSYDMVEVPNESYVVSDDVGEIYLCNPRCLCIWAILLATRPSLKEKELKQALMLKLPSTQEKSFDNISDLALWAAAHALRRAAS